MGSTTAYAESMVRTPSGHGRARGVVTFPHCVLLYYAGFRLTSAKAVQELDKWKKLEHVNVVSLREMFTTKAFGDHCE